MAKFNFLLLFGDFYELSKLWIVVLPSVSIPPEWGRGKARTDVIYIFVSQSILKYVVVLKKYKYVFLKIDVAKIVCVY